MVISDNAVRRAFAPRDPDELHRQATPLELFFDLVSVIAIASAAQGLHHAIANGHAGEGVLTFVLAFFAIWWSWMNYTWYASAYDNDGPLFRLITFWIMGGALVMAAGIPAMFAGLELTLVVQGYIVMRIGMVIFWLLAARHDAGHRQTALVYAVGIAAAQVYWVLAMVVFRPESIALTVGLYCVGVAIELAIPAYAESRKLTPWHRHHMIERYGLLNLIVLGEILLASALAFQQAGGLAGSAARLITTALCCLVIAFAMWWLYFSREDHLQTRALTGAFLWGYGHVFIYAAGAAVGAGFALAVEFATGHADVVERTVRLAIAIPLAVYMAGLWLVRDRSVIVGPARHVLLPFAVAVVSAAILVPVGIELIAGLAVLAVVVRLRAKCRSEIAAGEQANPLVA